MKKTDYKIAWFKIDFKRTQDDKLVIVDIGGGQTSSLEEFEHEKVRGAFCQSVLKYFDKLYISSCFQDPTFQRHILRDFILPARSNRAICKTSDGLQSMLNQKQLGSNDAILIVDQLKTAEIYSAYQYNKHRVPMVSGDDIFHILYRDKSVFYRLQSFSKTQPNYWHYPINLAALDIEKISKDLPMSKEGYYLKPSNQDVATGIKVFKTKQELINFLKEQQAAENTSEKKLLSLLFKEVSKHETSIMHSNQDSDYYDIQPKIVGQVLTHKNEDWDPTGRAFITLVYDNEECILIPEINGCSWILPEEPMTVSKESSSSLANVAHSKKFVTASEEDLEWLKNAFIEDYAAMFKICFTLTAEVILTQLSNRDANFQDYCKQMIYANTRYYVGKNREAHFKMALSDHANENIGKYLGLANDLVKKGKLKEAEEFCTTAAVFCDALLDRELASKWCITIYSTLAGIKYTSQNFDAAILMYQKALEHSPNNKAILTSIKNLERVKKNPSIATNLKPK